MEMTKGLHLKWARLPHPLPPHVKTESHHLHLVEPCGRDFCVFWWVGLVLLPVLLRLELWGFFYAKWTVTLALMRFLHWGQWVKQGAQNLQQPKWAHGKKSLLLGWSKQTMHILASFNLLLSRRSSRKFNSCSFSSCLSRRRFIFSASSICFFLSISFAIYLLPQQWFFHNVSQWHTLPQSISALWIIWRNNPGFSISIKAALIIINICNFVLFFCFSKIWSMME